MDFAKSRVSGPPKSGNGAEGPGPPEGVPGAPKAPPPDGSSDPEAGVGHRRPIGQPCDIAGGMAVRRESIGGD